jgi:hypothetical protein
MDGGGGGGGGGNPNYCTAPIGELRFERCGLGIESLTRKSVALFELNRSVERLKKKKRRGMFLNWKFPKIAIQVRLSF